MSGRDPERDLVLRVAPYGVPATIAAFPIGWLAGGAGTAWSATIGVALATLNLVASGLTVSRAARVSDMMLFMVSGLGVVVRLGVIVGVLVALRHLAFFSTLAFALAVIPTTLVFLVFELKGIAGGLGRELWLSSATGTDGSSESGASKVLPR
jgi:hypothetical protein